MRFIVALAAASLLTPLVSAQLILGTQDAPEIIDPPGDVRYDPTYTGPQDQAYLDVLSGWYSYVPDGDKIEVHLEGADWTRSAPAAALPVYDLCSVSANFTANGERTGDVRFSWSKDGGSSDLRHRVTFAKQSGPGVTTIDFVDVPHDFRFVAGKPGYATWVVNRTDLIRFGDIVESSEAMCFEVQNSPTGSPTIYRNEDVASSEVEFLVADQHPIQRVDEDDLPTSSNAGRPVSPTLDGKTASIGIASVLLMVTAAAILRRRA